MDPQVTPLGVKLWLAVRPLYSRFCQEKCASESMCVTVIPCDAIENQSPDEIPPGVYIMMWLTGRGLVLVCCVERSRPTETTSPVWTSAAAARRFSGVM